jgi:hypothetical protein
MAGCVLLTLREVTAAAYDQDMLVSKTTPSVKEFVRLKMKLARHWWSVDLSELSVGMAGVGWVFRGSSLSSESSSILTF